MSRRPTASPRLYAPDVTELAAGPELDPRRGRLPVLGLRPCAPCAGYAEVSLPVDALDLDHHQEHTD